MQSSEVLSTSAVLTLTVQASVAWSTGTVVEGDALRAGSAILAWLGLTLIDVRCKGATLSNSAVCISVEE